MQHVTRLVQAKNNEYCAVQHVLVWLFEATTGLKLCPLGGLDVQLLFHCLGFFGACKMPDMPVSCSMQW